MKQPPRQRPVKDGRDEQIDLQAKSSAQEYAEKPYRQVGAAFLIIGIALLAWFGITG